jgi:gluconate 5-dehydrogenase
MTDWLGLSGARVIVAGAGGLGSACASAFVEAGARVAVVDHNEDRLMELENEIGLAQHGGITICEDLNKRDAAVTVVDRVLGVFGGLDVLIHSVGINDRRPILDIDDEAWSLLMETNLSTGFRLGRAAGRTMCRQKSGRIIFISSVSGILAHKNHGSYAASKGGLNQLMRVMAAEWAAMGVTVNAVAPGYIETPLTTDHLKQLGVREDLVRLVPAERLGLPGEVAGPTLFLASRQANFVTGHVLYVDGGRTLV